jgi:hypothetical protein
MVKQTWATHANPPEGAGRRLPEAETILGIAKGLDVDPEAVILAIGETMGVLPPEHARPALLALLPPADVLDRLTPEDVDTVVRLVTLLAARARVPAASPDPQTPARGRTTRAGLPAKPETSRRLEASGV